MTHKRKQIREAVSAALMGQTSAGPRVFESRVRPLWKGELPSIGIFTEKEDASIFAESPREYKRTLTIIIECYATATENVDDALDALAEQVENLLHAAGDLNETVSDLTYQGVEVGLEGEGRTITGCARLSFLAEYYTTSGVVIPDTDVWSTAQIKINETDDTLELPQ